MKMAKQHNSKIDMTTGPIMSKVLLFAIPLILGSVLQQLYTSVDTLVIGQYCESTALAAVGTSSQPVEVLLCIFLGIGGGLSILVSQHAGAGNYEGLRKFCACAVSFVYMAGLALTVLGYFGAPLILRFMAVPEDTWNEALIYTRIVLFGTLGNIGYNLNAGVLRGLGDSRASLWFLVVSCVTNIILDYVFVAGVKTGVGGAALATSIAMMVSWIISIFYIKRRFPELGFTFFPRHIYGPEMKKMLSLGLPIGLNSSLYSFGHMALQSMVNAQGSVFMAAVSVGSRVTGLANIAITALSQASSAFSGQNYGARKYGRLKKGHLIIPIVSGLVSLAFGIVFILLRMPILRFFTKDTAVLPYASRYIVIMLLSQWIFAVFNGIINFVNGLGKVKYTTIVNLLMLWAVRVPVAFVITRFFDGTYVMFAYTISFSFGAIAMFGYYIFSKGWKEIMRKADEPIPEETGSP
ncbi:MAG: MATE family efflux transporter [Lachnospiraceae bacterium]|nr:MATE family efflux transporter [Lachnospiraceae bacterium]